MNRFTNRNLTSERLEYDLNEMLVGIMQGEFPDDEIYKAGKLTPYTLTQTINGISTDVPKPDVELRNGLNILMVSSGSGKFAEYKIDKTYPTVTEEDLDELIDEEWGYFIKQDVLRPVTETGLFLINTEIELNPADYHDAYIQRGPARINDRLALDEDLDYVVRTTFCVYYVENGVALPIPNYQTLEVLLVERGLTYDSIQEATVEQLANYDMNLDGSFIGDRTADKPADALEEFQYRQVLDRSRDWNQRVRFDSGYRPKTPFFRDPGDYMKPSNYEGGTGTSDIYVSSDPNDLYFDLTFQKQTYKEKLRAKYEGRMIILSWPVPYTTAAAESNTQINSDDLVYNVRMMVNGFWKQVIDANVFRLYASINEYDLSTFIAERAQIDGDNINELYGERGLINLLISAGGIDVVQNTGDNSPVWNDFPHIVEANRLDIDEYKNYLDNFSNAGAPFDINNLKPYEPEGSMMYYPAVQVLALQQQVSEQQEIEALRIHIQELWPQLAARVASLDLIAMALPQNYAAYYNSKFGTNSPLYKIMTAASPYKYIKRKRRGVTEKDTRTNLLEMFERNERISAGAFNDPSDADRIVGVSKWGRVWNNQPDSFGINAIDVIIAVGNTAYAGYLFAEAVSDLSNLGKNALPRNQASVRKRALIKDASYVRGMIEYELGLVIQAKDLYKRASDADIMVSTLNEAIAEAKDFIIEVDTLLINADSVTEFQDIYTRILALNTALSSFNDDGLEFCDQVRKDCDFLFLSQLDRLYKGVQYFRQRVHDEIGNRSKFGVVWSSSARSIIEQYLPGKTFDDYLPTEE
jgi:hypothetical protein